MSDTFSFDGKKKYIIYGAGGNSFHAIRLLKDHGCNVKYVIDRRAEEIKEVLSVPTVTIDQIEELCEDKDECIVIIAIKNVFSHVSVARLLLDKGFSCIIYKPYGVLQGQDDEEWNSIDCVYESIIENRNWPNQSQCEAVHKTRKDHLVMYKNELYISKEEESVWALMPIELILNYNREDAYGLLPMIAYYPLLNVYRWLISGKSQIGIEEIEYELCLYSGDWLIRTSQQLTERLKKSMLQSRIDVYYEMDKKSNLDMDFFSRNAVEVTRLDTGAFYLSSSGRNRVSFMIAKGRRYIPVKMSTNCYNEWLAEDQCKAVLEIFNNKGIGELFSTLPHPVLSGLPAKHPDYIRLWCQPIISYIIKKLHFQNRAMCNEVETIDYEKWIAAKKTCRIVVAMEDEGTISRLLTLYKFYVVRYSRSNIDKEVARLIDTMVFKEEVCREAEYLDKINLEGTNMIIADSKTIGLSELISSDIVDIFYFDYEDTSSISGEMICETMHNGKLIKGWHITR